MQPVVEVRSVASKIRLFASAMMVVMGLTTIAAQADVLPSNIGTAPQVPLSNLDWIATTAYPTDLGIDPLNGLQIYQFNYRVTNIGATTYDGVYDILYGPMNFGIHDGVWNPALEGWTLDTVAYGTVIARPYNFAGYVDPATPQYPVYFMAAHLAPGGSADFTQTFEVSPVVGYLAWGDYVVAVPEPATVALLGAGLIAMGFGTRKRRSKTS